MDTHKGYTTTQKEILIIVDTLKYFCMILLGNKIMVYPGHKNLTHRSTENGCDRLLRQSLIIKEYTEELKYIKFEDNYSVNVLSRSDFNNVEVRPKCFLGF